MNLHDAAADYLAYLQHEQRATTATVRTYRSGLNAFLRWMQESGRPDPTTFDFTAPLVRRYIYGHSERGLRPRTLRGKLHPIRGLARYLVTNDALKDDPTANLKPAKMDEPERRTVTEAEVRALLDAVERIPSLRRMALCRAVLASLTFGGLRRMEVVALKVGDYDRAENALHVRHGKGDKARTVYLPDDACHALDEWLAVRETDAGSDYLFTWDRRRRVGYEGIVQLLAEIKAIAGLRGSANIACHALRHFFATHLMRAGGDLEAIRQLLGHTDLRTTAIYLSAGKERLKIVAQLAALPERKEPKEALPDNVIDLRTRQRPAPFQDRVRRRIAR